MEAIIIKPNEENVEVVERDKPFELEELQKHLFIETALCM